MFTGTGVNPLIQLYGKVNDVMYKIITDQHLVPLLRGSLVFGRCPWCNGYCCREWTWRHEFKSWTRLIAFHIALILLGKV